MASRIRYWVLAAREVENNPYFSPSQHRGNIGEGQLHIRHDNIDQFSAYEVKPPELLTAIGNAYAR